MKSTNIEALAEAIKPLLIKSARDGLVYTYDLLMAQPSVAQLLCGDRREFYDALDLINDETSAGGYLLSAVVISDSGIPGPGFFRKLRGGTWSPVRAPRSAQSPDHAVFRAQLARVFSQFRAPRKVAIFIDLENLPQVQKYVVDAVVALRKKHGTHNTYTVGFYHPTPSSNWKRENLEKIRGMKTRKAHKDAAYKTSAADTVLIGEWRTWVLDGHQSDFFSRVILTPGDVVCLFSDDPIYHDSALKAMDEGFEVWGFGDGGREDVSEQLAQYRDTFNERGCFFSLRAPEYGEEWDFSPRKDG